MRKILLAFLLTLGVAVAAADAKLAPDALVRNSSGEVLNVLSKQQVSPSDKQFQDMLEAKVLPSFDFVRITQLALGRHWRDATPDQQTAITREFRTLLIRTYSVALTNSKLRAIDVKPVTVADADKEATVNTIVQPVDGKPVKIDYRMLREADGWKICDVQVEGVSLVTNYRTAFNDKVQQGGIDALLKDLVARNAAPSKS